MTTEVKRGDMRIVVAKVVKTFDFASMTSKLLTSFATGDI